MFIRFRFLAVPALLFSFLSVAADNEGFELTRYGTNYEEVPFEDLIDEDKKLLDSALEPVLKLIDLGRGGVGRIREAGRLLEKLLKVHRSREVGTGERMIEMGKIRRTAKNLIAGYEQSGKDLLVYAPEALAEEIKKFKLEDSVREFLIAYTVKHLKSFECFQLQVSAALGCGASLGLGGGVTTHLSGKRRATFCCSIGQNKGFGCDVTVEYSDSISEGHCSSHHCFHGGIIACIVKEIRAKCGARAPHKREETRLLRGGGIGLCYIESKTKTLNLPFFPLPGKNYEFAKKLLGITYESEPSKDSLLFFEPRIELVL